MGLFGSKKKIDAVVLGVRYGNNGDIEWVRAHRRRGATWSDWLLISREDLIERLKAGDNIVMGERIPYQAGTFHTSEPLKLAQANGRDIVVIGTSQSQDRLEGVPVV